MPALIKKKKKKLVKRKNKYASDYLLGLFGLLLISLGIAVVFFTRSTPCANSISCINNLSGTYDKKSMSGEFLGQRVSVPSEMYTGQIPQQVLGETSVPKRIYVDLTNQRLFAMEGGNLKFNFPISSGKWGKTPVGEFRIWYKVKYTRMTGGDPAKGDYYDLPNVPFTMFFYNKKVPKTMGYGIHGAYWHNKFGQPMSHGCINMRPEDAETLYFWADPYSLKGSLSVKDSQDSTPITIYGDYQG